MSKGDNTAGVESLSQRQKEILRLVAQSLEAKEIARALNISERTVRTHMEEARKRLGVARSRDAARLLTAYECRNTLGNDDRPPPLPIAKEENVGVSPARDAQPSGDGTAGERGDRPAQAGALTTWQWLGLMLLVAIVMPMIVAVVLEAAVFAIRSVHDLKEQFH